MKHVSPPFGDRVEATPLPARTTRQILDRKGERVVCLQGQIWITQHHDVRDVVLEAGQCFELDRPGLAVVFALKDAVISVGRPAANAGPCGI